MRPGSFLRVPAPSLTRAGVHRAVPIGLVTGIGAGGVCAVLCGYLGLLTAAAARPVTPPRQSGTRPRLVVLVPAHDEEELIGRCLESLREQEYDPDRYRVVVVADNCSDATAVVAAQHGAEVLERHDPVDRGKGQALRWGMDRILTAHPEADAVVVVDADSVADSRLLSQLAGAVASGADVVQAEYLALEGDGSPRAELRSAALLLFHRVRFRGRAALGLPCHLVGNGMAFSRPVLLAHPWQAFSHVEDLEQSLQLRLHGVDPVFAPEALVRAPIASGGQAARTQRLRWEGGRLQVARARLPELLRTCLVERRWSLWDAALDLAVPPLGLLAMGVVAGGSTQTLLVLTSPVPAWTLVPWAGAALFLLVHVVGGLAVAQVPPSTYRALAAVPGLLAEEAGPRLRVLLGGGHPTQWQRTPRPAEEAAGRAAASAAGRPR